MVVKAFNFKNTTCLNKNTEQSWEGSVHVNLMFPFFSGGLLGFSLSVCFAEKTDVSFVAISKT